MRIVPLLTFANLLFASASAADLSTTLESPKTGDPWTLPGVNLDIVPIAPGTFTMGSPNYATDGYPYEGPPFQATFTKPFWMGKFDVTVGQWRTFIDETHYKTEAEVEGDMDIHSGSKWVKTAHADWRHPGFSQRDDEPVVGVSWGDAMKFGQWLTDRERGAGRLPEGYVYALPTEAQWEYACAAGASNQSYTGSLTTAQDHAGWDSSNSGGRTHPVGQFKPNAWGLYDMYGNVWQWCRDFFGAYPSGNGVVNPSGPSSGSKRIFRGYGWCGWGPRFPSDRLKIDPAHRSNGIGFRIALSPES